jgi:hypothetical protein
VPPIIDGLVTGIGEESGTQGRAQVGCELGTGAESGMGYDPHPSISSAAAPHAPRQSRRPLPIDGRYARSTEPLRAHLSEAALIRERIRIEAEWLLMLAAQPPAGLAAAANIPAGVLAAARELATQAPASAAAAVKAIEQRTNHDVKAVEYYVRDQLGKRRGQRGGARLVHFGCTSEDINNLAYSRMLLGARTTLLAEFTAVGRLAATVRPPSRRSAHALAHPRADRESDHARQGIRQRARPSGARERPLATGSASRQVERRGRQLQRPRGGAARQRLAGDRPAFRRIARSRCRR